MAAHSRESGNPEASVTCRPPPSRGRAGFQNCSIRSRRIFRSMEWNIVTHEMSPHDDEAENVILSSIDRFLERDVAPYAQKLEHDDLYPEDTVARMKELGLFGATIDTAYGGLGLSTTIYARIVERISRVWMSVTGIFNSHLIMAAAVQRFGTEAQKQAYLPRFATGELRGGLALTEPDCGTDLQAIRTVARRRGDG